MHRIDGPGATVDNKFTDGDPVGGIQATVVTDDFLNDVQEELMSVLLAAGVAPVKGIQNQLLNAISALTQTQKATSFTTTGTSTLYAITPVPAIAAYSKGQRFNVTFHVSSGAAPAVGVSNLASKLIKQYGNAGAKVAAVIAAGQVSDIVDDGTDFILVDQLPSDPQAASEAVSGVARIGTQAEIDSGVLDNVIVTPKKIRFGFAWSFGVNGYIVFPTWLQGFIVQWGMMNAGASSVSFPIAFTTQAMNIELTVNSNGASASADGHYFGTLSTTAFTRGSTYTNPMRYWVWGY